MSQRKFQSVRFHGPVTIFGKELSNVNVINNPDMGVTLLASGWVEIARGGKVTVLPPSTIETMVYLENNDEKIPKNS